MSGGITAAVVGVVGAAAGIYANKQQQKAQARALDAQKAAAAKQEKMAEQSMNAANSTKANAALSLANAQQQQDGIGSTMLTGASGISSDKLKLGKSSLLGG